MNLKLIADCVTFYSEFDEKFFFDWLKAIGGVSKVSGSGTALEIELSAAPSNEDLYEILGLFIRYNIDLSQLAQFATDENRSWFSDPIKEWYAKLFPV